MSETFWKLVQCPHCNCSTAVHLTVYPGAGVASTRESDLQLADGKKPYDVDDYWFRERCRACQKVYLFRVTSQSPFEVEVTQ